MERTEFIAPPAVYPTGGAGDGCYCRDSGAAVRSVTDGPLAQAKLSAALGSPLPVERGKSGNGHSGRIICTPDDAESPAYLVATMLSGALPRSTQSMSASSTSWAASIAAGGGATMLELNRLPKALGPAPREQWPIPGTRNSRKNCCVRFSASGALFDCSASTRL